MQPDIEELEKNYGRIVAMRTSRKDDRNRVVIGSTKDFDYDAFKFQDGKILLIPRIVDDITTLKERKLLE